MNVRFYPLTVATSTSNCNVQLHNSTSISSILRNIKIAKNEKQLKSIPPLRDFRLLYLLRLYSRYLNFEAKRLSKYWFTMLQYPLLLEMSDVNKSSILGARSNSVQVNDSVFSATDSTQKCKRDINKADKWKKEKPLKLPLSKGLDKNFQERTPKWKNTSFAFADVTSRVKHILTLIDNAESVQSRLKRIELLIEILLGNPDAKLIAVKEGAIRKLLQVRRRTKDNSTHSLLRQAFALLGHVDSLPCKGIRILSIDGGGIRGIAVIEMLKKLEELTGKKIYELFDYICGVSTGSILVSCIGTPQGMTLDEALSMYTELGTKLFTQSAFWGVSNLVLSRAYYDTSMFETLLKKFVGETPLIKTNTDAKCPKLASVSTVMNQSSIMPFVFRNYSLPYDRQSQYLGSCKYTLFESVRASGAAPTVFQEFCLDGMIHQDGGILVNNPCAVAIHEAKLLWPNCEIQCVVSCGTGRHAPVSVAADSSKSIVKVSSVSWKTLFNKILESATDTEAVHSMLNDLLPTDVYFRFNPYLTDLIPMHENKPDKISQLREDTTLYIRKNEEKFIDAATNLLIKRTLKQKVADFLVSKTLEYNLTSKL